MTSVLDSYLNGLAESVVRNIQPFLKVGDRILDIGCGGGHVTKKVRELGYSVSALDVQDVSKIQDVVPVIYDGIHIPFPDSSFDVALLTNVLHHTVDPISILREAARVSRRILVIEDVYTNVAQKYLTFAMDSLLNLEFFGHPHSNKTIPEWEHAFAQLNLAVEAKREHTFWIVFRSATFSLVQNSSLVEMR